MESVNNLFYHLLIVHLDNITHEPMDVYLVHLDVLNVRVKRSVLNVLKLVLFQMVINVYQNVVMEAFQLDNNVMIAIECQVMDVQVHAKFKMIINAMAVLLNADL